ncbi:isoprenylcysteine carboxylmethyltransferase family protein [Mycobacterium intracellulare]|uniref:Isoprenylcysteine carboxylmethyltransferase family protein n=1 Tax=Mycobacterium intracellulare TaxID=1767 RepID=A0AAE4UFL5_MYCIT|nr:isoprenylcysteine carboxylmethyltransferase family protein [Mycobacterium intracellulare]MCA2322312.1 isoprenylcysteine carboxylmethyltransferase family protein [Mycobacterium intracellulare]MCA2343497.1 isoprenylcysteine carboxylmethyltransferase family protein [Mycobacterium intracellulare]MDV6978464.1 isoprenylcysteine carboxylmethyltransferase family protein [Mycobacterium intracellulare]MDV6985335.1 isoprenylcysteine carboxylmethyltransferase family protein [Mycobacterium intracellulare
MKTGIRVTTTSLGGILSWVLILLLPAGTLHYWQAWVFIAVFTVATIVPTVYLSRANPAALQRRMRAGPRAEPRTSQKFIITASFLGLFATMVFSALDHRFGWSSVPVWLSLLGDLLVATGLGIAMLVIVQNSYAGATVTVEADQTLVSGGLYRFVRHPMYVGNVIMMIGIPLALDSYWGLLFVIPGTIVLALRMFDEEKLLFDELPGYREYAERVRYRLVPYLW